MIRFEEMKNRCAAWTQYTRHDFVHQLGDGSLPREAFQHYLKQDYRFLVHFTRAWALAIYKSENFSVMRAAQANINALLDMEIQLHIEYCRTWGISEAELDKVPESAACVAYTRYVLDSAMVGGLPELYAALLPCCYGYAEIGRELAAQQKPGVKNPYADWINVYSSEEFMAGAREAIAMFEQLASDCTPAQAERIQGIFHTATRMEVAFWQMGLDLS